MSDTLSPEDSRVLIDLCRAGKLYEVEKWITSGKSTRTSVQIKKTPLQVAIEIGFHSLVELLIRNEERLEVKNRFLAQAVERKRIDLVELLASYGAEIRSVPLFEVFLTWEPRMIGFFLDHGADVVTGALFASAFREKVRREGANRASSVHRIQEGPSERHRAMAARGADPILRFCST